MSIKLIIILSVVFLFCFLFLTRVPIKKMVIYSLALVVTLISILLIYLNEIKIGPSIDTSFVTMQMKDDLLQIFNIIKGRNILNVSIENGEISCYDNNRKNISIENSLLIILKSTFEKYEINSISRYSKPNNNLDGFIIRFVQKEALLLYTFNKSSLKEGYVIPVLVGRIEKIIDDNWYILRRCNSRNICPEPQE